MSNKATKNYKLKVGYTVFVGLIILFVFILLVGTEGYYFSKTYNLNILVKSTRGLIEGSKVSLGGLKIGQIDKIEFVTINDENLVKIKLELLEKHSSQITVTSFAKVETSGLLGDKMINISLGNAKETHLKEGDYLPVKSSLSFDDLSDKIEPLVENVNKFTSNLKIITDTIATGKGSVAGLILGPEISVKLNKLIANLDLFTFDLNKQNSSLGKFINDDKLYNEVTEMSSDLKDMINKIKNGKGTLGKFLTNDSLYNNLNDITTGLNKIILKFDSDSTLIGSSLSDKDLYIKFNSLIDELNSLITDIKENPDRYLNISVF